MKSKFSNKWIGSKQPRKQKKYRINAPLHTRHKMTASNLSKELRVKFKRRSFPLRKNDKVKVMRGKFQGKEGKINDIDLKRMKVGIEGVQIQKKDGTKINVYLDPSNLMILELNMEDKERTKSMEKEKKHASEKK